jgi:membrane-bound ClpP family serine protease
MKFVSLAICSLGIWVLLGSFIDGSWVGIVFGAIAAVLALVGAGKSD